MLPPMSIVGIEEDDPASDSSFGAVLFVLGLVLGAGAFAETFPTKENAKPAAIR